MGPRASLDRCGKSHHHRIFFISSFAALLSFLLSSCSTFVLIVTDYLFLLYRIHNTNIHDLSGIFFFVFSFLSFVLSFLSIVYLISSCPHVTYSSTTQHIHAPGGIRTAYPIKR